MANTNKESDQDYLVLRSRKVLRRQVEYEDAESRLGDSGSDVAEGGWTNTKGEKMESEKVPANNEMEGERSEESEEEEKMTYRDFVQSLQLKTHAMIAHSIKEMCKELGKAFAKKSQEKDETTKILAAYAVQREKLIDELIKRDGHGSPHHGGRFKEPMLFSGDNPREWLMQMRQYYDLRGFDEELRLKDAPFYLRGDAHMFYYTLVRHYPERLPRTWEEFERLFIQRFCSRTPVETLQRLMQIKYRDSVSDVTTQFARVCAEGDPIPQEKLIHVYLSRFPKAMVDEAMKEDFSTWVEASEYLQRQNRRLTMKLAEWYQLAPPEFKREVEMDKQCMREGWILKNPVNTGFKSLPPGRQGLSGKGAEGNKAVPGGPRNHQGQEKPNFIKFLETLVCHQCQGRGHRAKECPSRDMATRRDGSRCRKCRGLGH